MKKTFTPKIGIMVIVLVLIISAVLMVSKRNESTSLTTSASKSPGMDSPTLAANAEKDGPGIGDYYAGPSDPPSATTSATPIPKPPELSTYVYPGSKTLASGALKLDLESNASAETITAWYKSKIESGKFNAKSYAQTNTNGDILNKLSAAKPGEKLDITIKKDQSTSKVLITVDRS